MSYSTSTLSQASTQWATRPQDERFTSLEALHAHVAEQRMLSKASVISSRRLRALPDASVPGHKGLLVQGPDGVFAPTHQSFGQLATLAQAPAGYLRTLPSEMASDCINYGLQVARDVEDVGILTYRNGSPVLRAATGPAYGRIWNDDVVEALVSNFGNGVDGRFRVPGIFGVKLDEVTKENTTLFAGDRDMFVFLADEENRIEVPGRRDGQAGSLARGFFVWNSEVGAATFGIKSFLFDYVCCNRIVWGAQDVKQITIRHTAKAPDRMIEEVTPALLSYANSSTTSITHALEEARKVKLEDKVDDFLATRFGNRLVARIKAAHEADEGRPIETAWDAVVGATAYARSLPNQDARVQIETEAGKLLV
jgi:hypothetical protein